jgi:iron complex transport system permease protein
LKVTIDLDKLLEERKITRAEYDKFSQYAARDTSALAFNILVGFGVIDVSGAALALIPISVTAIILGLVICIAGITLIHVRYDQWMVLANICVLVGALLFGGGVVKACEGSISSFLLVAAAFAAAGIFTRSSLLAVLSVVSLSSCLGTRTGYFHATYFLGIKEPTLTVALFTIFSIGAYQLSKRLAADYQAIAIAASRTGVFLVNFGFWIGSLWGDRMVGGEINIADWVFAILWAIALIAAGVWAWKRNRRWLVNIVAVFGAIHFYTQWFERLGASAETVLIGGLLALGFAIGLRSLNAKFNKEA